jgi:DNA repair exonuclease SbcCD ATPase subunit
MESIKKELSKRAQELSEAGGRRKLLIEQINALQTEYEGCKAHSESALKARAVLQEVAQKVQQKIEFQISNLVSMALATIFPDPYTFELKYTIRRNKTEADLIFSKNEGATDDILNTGGGGVADIASLALRIAAWSIKQNRHVLILDEPTKYLHNPEYQRKASELIKEISKEIGLQFIIISDQEEIISAADKQMRVVNEGGVSSVEN